MGALEALANWSTELTDTEALSTNHREGVDAKGPNFWHSLVGELQQVTEQL